MNTTAAAAQAKVTTATIRTWCRRNVIAATKTSGRWVIDTASLARRIAIGARRARKAIAYTAATLTAIGGSRWQRGDMDRIYFNNWAALAGLEINYYKSGNISGAFWQGELVSNSQGGKLAATIQKLWFDLTDGKFHVRYGLVQSREATRDEVFQAALAGIRTAIAAL